MTKARTGDRNKRLLIFFGLGIMIFAMALPLMALIPGGGSQPRSMLRSISSWSLR